MGQFFFVMGQGPEARQALCERAEGVFRKAFGVSPQESVRCESLAGLKFARLEGRATALAKTRDGHQMVLGAGTWILDDAKGPEGVLKAWDAGGDDDRALSRLADRIDGNFALALVSPRRRECVVLTDRLGLLHVYRTEIDGCLVLSTSSLALALLSHPGWDFEGVRQFLAMGSVFGDRSLFKGIQKLGPGMIYRYHDGRLRGKTRYWRAEDLEYDGVSTERKVAEVADALQESLWTVFKAFPKPRLDLTGGLDSRALFGAAQKLGVQVCTVVNGPRAAADVRIANDIARRFDVQHVHNPPPEGGLGPRVPLAERALFLTDGEYDAFEYTDVEYYQRLSGSRFDISVNGSGGEVAKGYWWELLYPHLLSRRHFDPLKLARLRFATDGWSDDLLAHTFDDTTQEQVAQIIAEANQSFANCRDTAKVDNAYLVLRMQRWQGRIASATNRLNPVISPFFFRAPLEACLTAKPSSRMHNRLSRRLIEHLDPALAAMPLSEGYPALPIRWSTVHKFGPMFREIAGKAAHRLKERAGPSAAGPAPQSPELRAFVGDEGVQSLLKEETLATRDLYRPDALCRLLQDIQQGAGVNEAHLGRFLTLELVARSLASYP